MSFIAAHRLTKRFGAFVANDEVSLEIERGEIHGIVGENGAGKSTLMKMLYGMLTPDSGEIQINQKVVQFQSPLDALAAGIGMVHQHFMLVERMSVLENFILGAEPTNGGVIDETRALKSFDQLMREANAVMSPKVEVRSLTVGQQQRLEILKLLYRKSDCLIFDEPTGVLTPQEVEKFLESLRQLRAQGKTILLITHKLNEVLAVCDRVTVMRAGKTITTTSTKGMTQKELARLLVGRDVRLLDQRMPRKSQEGHPVQLRLRQVSTSRLKDVSLEISAGEILGLAGIEGNGQRDLAEVLMGLELKTSGDIHLEDAEISNWSIEKRKQQGLGFIPEDRHHQGLLLDFSLTENFYFGAQMHFQSKCFIPFRKLRSEISAAIRQFEIKASGPEALARSLSGGNQQKVVVARELYSKPKVLICSQPTRGVDIGAIERIHEEIIRQRDAGMAILLISSELDELLALSDRVIAIREGALSGEFKNLTGDWTPLRFQIGEAMICAKS